MHTIFEPTGWLSDKKLDEVCRSPTTIFSIAPLGGEELALWKDPLLAYSYDGDYSTVERQVLKLSYARNLTLLGANFI